MASELGTEVEVPNWLFRPSFPKHWRRDQLYSLAKWVNGLAFRDFHFASTGKPVIKIAEIKGGITGQTKFTTQIFDDKVLVKSGDMLFSWSGQPETSIDVFWWRGRDGWLNQHVFKVTPIEELDRIFFFYLLRYLKPNFIAIARNKQTTGLGHVTKGNLQEIEAAVPPLPEQKAIAAVLGALDDKIELNRRMNATLEAMARALFQSWFVDFDPVHAKAEGRLPAGLDEATAALFPAQFQDSELGEIPKAWTVGRIRDCCLQIQNGGTPRRNEPRFWDGGDIPWLASGEVRQAIVTGTVSFITEDGLAESSAKWVPAFSTVVALYGATAGQVSLTASRLTTNQAVCAMVPKEGFAYFNYLTMRGATAELENKAVGSAQQNISKGIVEETKVILPPPCLIARFAEVASPLFELWIANLNQSRTLATLRDTLLPQLVNGDLTPR